MRKASVIRKIGLFGIAASLVLGLSGPMVVVAEESVELTDQQDSLVAVDETVVETEEATVEEPDEADEATEADEAVEATEDAEPEKAAPDAPAEEAAEDEALPAKAAWDGARTITAGTPAKVEIEQGSDGVWFKFMPAKTADYLIYSSGASGDPYGYLYNSTSDTDFVDSGDDEAGDYNFLIKAHLTEGKTYYILASSYDNESGSYTLTVKEDLAVTKVTAKAVSGKSLVAGNEGTWESELVDGKAVKCFSFYTSAVKNCIQLTETYEDGTTGSPVSADDYYLVYENYVSGPSLAVTVFDNDTDEEVARVDVPVFSFVEYMKGIAKPFSFGSVKTTGDETIFGFTPGVAGTYRFVLAVGTESASMALANSDGEEIDYASPYDANTSISLDAKLDAGKSYYLYVWGKATVSLSAVSVPASNLVVSGVTAKTYTGSAQTQNLVVKNGSATLRAGVDYAISYQNNVNAGTATVTITGKNGFTGSKSVTFKINKAANTMRVKGKTVKAAPNKKKIFKKSKAFNLKKAKGKVTFKKTKGSKLISVNKKTGKVTVKPGLAKGTYKIKVKVTAKGNANYKPAKKVVTIKVKVQ